MKKNRISIQDLITFLGDDYIGVYGDTQGVFIDNLADMEHVNETTLDWVKPSNPNKQEIVENTIARLMFSQGW